MSEASSKRSQDLDKRQNFGISHGTGIHYCHLIVAFGTMLSKELVATQKYRSAFMQIKWRMLSEEVRARDPQRRMSVITSQLRLQKPVCPMAGSNCRPSHLPAALISTTR
ncbi:unnamed protein product [Wuchereria bancrofti]|uniref:Uncharacterized protein n=1 Tax=Wuchereria bancrofti TaxID=6293 RepID=A0A3P7EV97_WUCBA|nr:unnamed protein product [Wuchereria bancrofti]